MGCVSAAGRRRILEVVMHVAGDKQIELAVTVIVAKGRAVGPVAERHAGLFGNVGEGSVMVVVIETVLSEIADIQIWPAIIVVVAYSDAKTPAAVGYASFRGNIGEGAIVIVMEEGRVRWLRFAIFSLIGRAVHQINIEPAIMIVVQQGHTRASCFHDEVLLRLSHPVAPDSQAGFFGDILEDDGAGLDKAARSDRPFFGIENGREHTARRRTRLLRARVATIYGRSGLCLLRRGPGSTRKKTWSEASRGALFASHESDKDMKIHRLTS